MQLRAAIRIAFVVVFTAIAVIVNGCDVLLPWHPFATFGFAAATDGTVVSVDRVAEQHGLHPGDRIDVKRLSPSIRQDLAMLEGTSLSQGAMVAFPLSSGRIVTIPAHAYARSLMLNVTDVSAIVALWICIGIAAALVLIRPMPATWAFYVFMLWFCAGGVLIAEFLPFGVNYAIGSIRTVAAQAAAAAFLSFALRFPNARPAGVSRLLERAVLYGVAPALALLALLGQAAYVFGAIAPPAWVNVLTTGVVLALYLAGIFVLVVRYAGAGAGERSRLQWVVVAFSFAFAPYLGGVVAEELFLAFSPIWFNLADTWMIIAPVALAYSVLRHRLFDVRLVVSRALIYGIMTSIVVGALALVDWAFGLWLSQSRFALVAELLLALLLGAALTTLHNRIDQVLNAIIFRAQAIALQTLRRFADETDLIGDPQRLIERTYEALRTRLETDYAAIYTADGSSYAVATAAAASTPPRLPGDDFVVLRLRRWGKPFECDEPEHAMRGALFLPMIVRGQLVGFLVCGPKRDRTHYLPEEVDTLVTLAHRVGTAYAWLTLRPASDALAAQAR